MSMILRASSASHPLAALFPGFESLSVGFDRQWQALADLTGSVARAAYPPYNIRKHSEDSYSIDLAVAGFRREELSVHTESGILTIRGEHTNTEDDAPAFLHRGIAARSFTQRIALSDQVKVTGAALADGILTIALTVEVPEAARRRDITIA